MKATRRRDTPAEIRLRLCLHRLGLRYRVDVKPLRSLKTRADVLFPRARVAVFVDGCFWHSCPDHASVPQTNRDWWIAKLAANRARDERVTRELQDAGWLVLRFWTHEDMDRAAARVKAAVRQRQEDSRRAATSGRSSVSRSRS
jgi:DNA mismatch endonuclease (patch repair protein)